MFAVFNVERDPLTLESALGWGRDSALFSWIQDVGGFAAAGLLFWSIAWALGPRRFGPGRLFALSGGSDYDRSRLPPRWAAFSFTAALILAAAGYGVLAVVKVPQWIDKAFSSEDKPDAANAPNTSPMAPSNAPSAQGGDASLLEPDSDLLVSLHTLAAACAILAVSVPFLINIVQLRWRRIWGMAMLSYKEAVRGRILYVLAIPPFILFLFLGWFSSGKREEQLYDYVNVVYWAMTFLLLISGGLISAFAIPKDIRNQTIHTVVTKPVERFEIIVGRFLGFTLLMSLVLLGLTTVSLLYLLRGINPDSAEESLKARDPHYGRLTFLRFDDEYTDRESVQPLAPENVGREWNYHKYISGAQADRPRNQKQYALWTFDDLPSGLADRDEVRCEFNFDIYRSTKGEENQGVAVNVYFETHNYLRKKSAKRHSDYVAERLTFAADAHLIPEKDNELSEEYGYFEVNRMRIGDYHTMSIDLPAGVIRNALKNAHEAGGRALLRVRVTCDSNTQYIGMARYSLYLRQDDATQQKNVLAFAVNFYKASLGLGMRLILIVGLCVALSTELGGIISFLTAILIYIGGICREFIQEVIANRNDGGGPSESFLRLVRKDNLVTPLDETTINKVATTSDDVYRWVLGRVIKLLPDVDRYSFTVKVANGFNIGVFNEDLLPAFLILLGYMFPWFVVGYYLLRTREIAGAH